MATLRTGVSRHRTVPDREPRRGGNASVRCSAIQRSTSAGADPLTEQIRPASGGSGQKTP